MKMDRLDELLAAGHAAGILPAPAARSANDRKPWPLVLMIGLGAWLSAIPLIAFFGFILGDVLLKGGGAYVLGALLLGFAVFNFRRETSVFVEQLGLPLLLTGGGLLGLGLARDTQPKATFLMLACLAVMVAVLVPRAWLRVLLGALASGFVTLTFTIGSAYEHDLLWLGAHATLLAWLAASVQRHSVVVESAGAGWLLMTLISLAAWSGATFMLGSAIGFEAGHFGATQSPRYLDAAHLVSAVSAACGAAWLAKAWPALRQVWSLIVAVVLVGLSWLNPTLGATLLALAVCLAGGRWLLASAAGVGAAWIIGAFYYQLSMPLASKALVMIGAAITLGAVAWLASPRTIKHAGAVPIQARAPRSGVVAIALSCAAVLVVVNAGIWQKENLLAQSQAVFVELAPVDPRSIMQGDYMALNFRLPSSPAENDLGRAPQVVAKLDERGVATLIRFHQGEPLAAGELAIELTRRAGRWTMVSNAWYFKESEVLRWSKAKYGEFRVDGNGRALLVGLRGPNLEAL